GVALRRQLAVERAGLVALCEVVSVVVEAHGLGLGEAGEHGAAELARVALAGGIERPAPFPAVDPHRERARWRGRGFDGGDLRIGLARENFRTGGLSPRQRAGHGRLCRGPGWPRGGATPQPPVWRTARRRGVRGAGALAGPNRPG